MEPAEDTTGTLLLATCKTLETISVSNEKVEVEVHESDQKTEITSEEQRIYKSEQDMKVTDEEKECSSILSVMSTEEVSITSEILDQKSFIPRKGSDGEDVNGHIFHIDSPETDTFPNSDALHEESLMDDISSVLCGFDPDSNDNTYTDDTTLFNSDDIKPIKKEFRMDQKLERRKSEDIRSDLKQRKRSLRRNSADKIRRTRIDEDTQFGFENRAFMTQLKYRYEAEPEKYCSLAQFVEGNDIARRSFKRNRPATKLSKTEINMNRQSTLTEESEGSIKDSRTSLNKLEKELSNASVSNLAAPQTKPPEEDKSVKFPQVSVIVEPPSPILDEQTRSERVERLKGEADADSESDYDLRNLCSKSERLSTSDVTTSNSSSKTNLLGIDPEHFPGWSPAATRRISCCSMMNPQEAAALAAAAATAKFYSDSEKKERKEEKEKENRTLPIINPLVRLPAWPSKYNEILNLSYLLPQKRSPFVMPDR